MNLLLSRKARLAGLVLLIASAATSLVIATEDRALAAMPQDKDKEKPEAKEKEKKDEPKKKVQGLPLEARPDDRVHDRRGDVGLARRLARRQDDRLRAAGRPVYRADRRGRGQGDHHRAGVRQPAALFARRQDRSRS